MPYLVYRITNTLTSKIYVGTTTNTLETRWNTHKSDVRLDHRPLYRAIREYGLEHFSIELIEECSDEATMYSQEIYWSRKLGSIYPQGYNLRCRLTDEEAAIVKYNIYRWRARQYADLFGLSVASIKRIQAHPPYNSYRHITPQHLQHISPLQG